MTAAVAALTVVAGPAAASSSDPLQPLADHLATSGLTGIQVRVTDDGRTRTVHAGTAVLGTDAPVPANGRFRIGSATKMFTSTVVLQLVGEGKVDLDSPVSRYLPGVLPDGDRTTVRMILQHTSGLHNYTDDLPLDGAGYLKIRFQHQSAAGLVAEAAAKPANFPPGTSWSYSNTNYLVAGMLIQAVTGHDWGDEVSRRIARPLGLRDTFSPGDSPFLGGPHAHGYMPVDGQLVDVTELNPTVAGAAGGLVSTPADLDRFLTALTGGKLLAPAQFAEMRQTLPDSYGYGLGFMATTLPCGIVVWGHEGGINGYNSIALTTLDGSHRLEAAIMPGNVTEDTSATLNTLINTALCP